MIYSETLVNEAKDLLEECINRPTVKYTLEERNEYLNSEDVCADYYDGDDYSESICDFDE